MESLKNSTIMAKEIHAEATLVTQKTGKQRSGGAHHWSSKYIIVCFLLVSRSSSGAEVSSGRGVGVNFIDGYRCPQAKYMPKNVYRPMY